MNMRVQRRTTSKLTCKEQKEWDALVRDRIKFKIDMALGAKGAKENYDATLLTMEAMLR